MAKRKAGVNDIIYELNNEDIEISSEDEVKESKISRLESDVTPISPQSDVIIEESCTDVVNVNSSCDEISSTASKHKLQNGGKMVERKLDVDEPTNAKSSIQSDLDTKKCVDYAKTTILNEDIVVDSPSSNYVNDFANRTPLLTVRFRNNKLASNYKEKIKAFMLNLIKLHDEESLVDSENETDLELDIWPEDFDEEVHTRKGKAGDNLFFVDTDPNVEAYNDIPSYSQASTLISNSPERDSTPPRTKWKPTCFNCDGDHSLRECVLPRNNVKIAENRKNMQKVGRYHIEDEQKYGHLIPGRISGHLRHGLGLKRHEIPLHIYRMRNLGYPPGWLEEARISHSGITMFDSAGQAILDPEEEEGELCDPGYKDKFDIKKILDFPGFNVPVSSRYKEEAHLIGLPPMSDQDSKVMMLESLAPNAMKAYKRKKLTFFPSAFPKLSQESQAEMELDSGDEEAVFPSVPPLPDEAPPPLPPPPAGPPPPPESPPPPPESPLPPPESPPLPPESPSLPPESPPPIPDSPIPPLNSSPAPTNNTTQSPTSRQSALPDIERQINKAEQTTDDDDLEVIEVMQVKDIPMPIDNHISIDVDDEKLEPISCLGSPSLDDLESKKRLLLEALKGEKKNDTVVNSDEENDVNVKNVVPDNKDAGFQEEKVRNIDEAPEQVKFDENNEQDTNDEIKTEDVVQPNNDLETSRNSESKTPGRVKGTEYGTPVINVASPYVKLPSDEKFAKDIGDIINFENLPNSIGTYKRMRTLLKKVKCEVDRIQES